MSRTHSDMAGQITSGSGGGGSPKDAGLPTKDCVLLLAFACLADDKLRFSEGPDEPALWTPLTVHFGPGGGKMHPTLAG